MWIASVGIPVLSLWCAVLAHLTAPEPPKVYETGCTLEVADPVCGPDDVPREEWLKTHPE